MDRDKFAGMLADYLGDELSSADRRAFEAHLASSDADRAEVESLQAALDNLRQLPPPPASGASAHPLPQAAHPKQSRAVVRYLYRPLAYAAMLVIGVGIGWLAKPAGVAEVPGAGPQPPVEAIIGTPRLHFDKVPSRFARNALALSMAFTQPTEATAPSSRFMD